MFITEICISFFLQFFIIILVITLYECKTEYDEQTKYIRLYKLQGVSINTYFFLRITYLLLVIGTLSVINTLIISLFGNNIIQFRSLEDIIVIVYAFIICSLSNLGLCFVITLLVKDFYVLVEIIFCYHFITIFSMGLIKVNNIILDIYLYFNGIYTYYYIFNSQLNRVIEVNNISSSEISKGFTFGIIQVTVYYCIYITIINIRYRSSKIHIINQKI